MIVEVGREVQDVVGNVTGYLGVLGLSPRTYGFWVQSYSEGRFQDQAPAPPSPEEAKLLEDLKARMKDLVHRRHYSFGLAPLWIEFRGRVRRETFRRIAREVREEVNRERRGKILRYEFTNPDVAHSIDYTEVPRELPGGAKRYVLKIMDDCTRVTLRRMITDQKGAGLGLRFVSNHLSQAVHPLVFKYDREFATPEFEQILVLHKIVPLPNPRRYPQANAKTERSFKDMKLWFGAFEPDLFMSYNELSAELDSCYKQLDQIEPRENLGGLTREQAYRQWKRAQVDREKFFQDAATLRHALVSRPGVRVDPNDAWRVAAKETLKKYELVRYSRP